MKPDSHSNKVLITGLEGFTGHHLALQLSGAGYDVIGLKSDITNRSAIFDEIQSIEPDYVVHLAAISFAAESSADDIYRVNVTGSLNLLDALCHVDKRLKKVVLASSATVYGNVDGFVLDESLCPKPVNHYGCSKLVMEHMAQNYLKKLPLLITRPFNYTGVGHSEKFLIPKIVRAYAEKQKVIELGNLHVSREFNDVRDICKIYQELLECKRESEVVNLCSGKTVSLLHIIELMNQLVGYEIEVAVNADFVRDNEIKDLSGDVTKLNKIVQPSFNYQIEDTLSWMFRSIND